MEVRVLPCQLQSLIPNEGVHAKLGFPMELDEGAFTPGVSEDECMNAKALHHARTSINRQHLGRLVLRLGSPI